MMLYPEKIICGKFYSDQLLFSLKDIVKILKEDFKVIPTLSIILANDSEASSIYVQRKIKAGEKIGINVLLKKFESNIKTENLLEKIKMLNEDKNVHGIIVQMPLPAHHDVNLVLNQVDVKKDVDGLTYKNLGAISFDKLNSFEPCTPKGIVVLLKNVLGQNLSGADVVIINRSRLVGLPLSFLLLRENCTVSITHSHTKNINQYLKRADIVVSAVGKKHFINNDKYIKKDAILIDVGISINDNKIFGDINIDKVIEKVKYVTPMPGGTGPMTVACLIYNVVKSAIISLPDSEQKKSLIDKFNLI